MSVVEVKDPNMSDVLCEAGLLDLRMGTTEREYLCKSCGCNQFDCPGHFGHIELAHPVIHRGYMRFIMQILRCVCFNCSAIIGRVSFSYFIFYLKFFI